MSDEIRKRADLLQEIADRGGLLPGVAREVARETGVPEATVYGAGSFYHLLDNPDVKLRVCTGLSCALAGANELLEKARAAGFPVDECSCLAACDRPPAVLRDRAVLVEVTSDDIDRAGGVWQDVESAAVPGEEWTGTVGPTDADSDNLVFDLLGTPDESGASLAKALEMGPDDLINAMEESGLQGRGGAGFPAAVKWSSVRAQQDPTRYIVLNADEGEPGTFKDREIMLRRPDLVVAGLAIAAHTIGAREIYCYLRGEFEGPWRSLDASIEAFRKNALLEDVEFHLHAGHGAYICGEETAMLEAIEGKRGMPRLKPPFPTEVGLWGKPTLIHNVETIGALPSIALKGGPWFKGLGRTEPGSKLYCVSGHVRNPGTYELPLGVTLDELVAAAGGYVGNLKAFSPGGASSGFLPASHRDLPLDFKSLAQAGSMLGSAGVVVLNDTIDIVEAVRNQLHFFEVESCGQCAPCRIGTQFQRRSLDRFVRGRGSGGGEDEDALRHVAETNWEMNEGSICGLGQAASLPLTSALRHFPEEFSR